MEVGEWPIIVGGCHRSGTSLLRRILNAHSRIHCGPEIKFFRDFYGDYPYDLLRHIRFTTTARAVLPEDDLLQLLGRAFIELQEGATARAGKARWADKNPENAIYLPAWERLLGERWLYVHVMRNPLDTLASMKEADFRLTLPRRLGARIAFYKRYTQDGLDFCAAHPDRSYRLLYERLAAAPEAELQKLMAWLGEELEPGQLAFNQVPQQAGLEDPKVARTRRVHATSVGRWPEVLTPPEARRVWRETRALWAEVDVEGRYPLPTEPPRPRFSLRPWLTLPRWHRLWRN